MQEAAVVTWPNADDPLALDRRVRIIDDLLGAILLLAALVFAALMELTRRRICAVYQLAFLLCAGYAVFIVGGLVDHHLSDDQLQLALYGSFLSSSLTTTYVYMPLGASAAAALVGVFHLSVCSCECCCLQGTRCASHRDCFTARLRANSALFATTFVMLWVLIGIRLNARLLASAINPVGGTVHWMLLRSPFYLAVAHIGSVAMVELKLFLQHADKAPASRDGSLRPQSTASVSQPTLSPPLLLAQAEAMSSTIDELMRPPPVAKIRHPTGAVASTSGTAATATATAIVRRASRPQTPGSEVADHPTGREDRYKAAPPTDTAKTGRRQPSVAGASTSQRLTLRDLETERPTDVNNDGDVSALISSDNDSDEDVLTPNFNAAPVRKKPLPPSSVAGSRQVASIASSEYSSSRPTSPALSSVSSRSSSSSSSNSSSASRPRAPPARYARPADKLLTRSRSSSSEHSFPIPRFVSDSEDGGPKRSYYYYSDSNNNRPMTASSTTSSFFTSSSLSTSIVMSGDRLRRRIPHTTAIAPIGATGTAHTTVKGPWVECFDAATGNVYYYNQVTGESRWQRNF